MNECLKGHIYGFHDSPIQPSKYDVKPQTINQSCDSVQARDTVHEGRIQVTNFTLPGVERGRDVRTRERERERE